MEPEIATECASKQEYLQFVQTLNNRIRAKAQNAGFTKWVLIAALVTIVWLSIPLLEPIRQKGLFPVLLGVYLHTHFALCFLTYIILPPDSRKIFGKLDFRIRIDKPQPSLKFFSIFTPLFVFPVLAGLHVICFGETFTKLQNNLIMLNIITVGTFTLFLLIANAFQIRQISKDGYPTHFQFEKGQTSGTEFISRVIFGVFFVLALGNVWGWFLIFLKPPPSNFTEVLNLGFNLSLISFLLFKLIISSQDNLLISELDNLERDIILHNLEGEEIKRRLEYSFFGQEIGSWLEDKLNNVKDKSENLLRKSRSVDDFIAEIKAIDPSMTLEIKGRIDRYNDQIEADLDQYAKDSSALAIWLRNAIDMNQKFMEEHLIKMMEKTIEDLYGISEEVRIAVKKTTGKMRASIESIFPHENEGVKS